ncbi:MULTISPECIES: TIGR03085 family metal-binding protein [Actinosynnema]|uniref:TIGR03085 family protein n=1 Tax=Actinosynnema pretiosum TaxID=42197 RepID=A0A290ZCL4_9PSEU|nr:TIGR03085 family metal-binding protein [Actinosynnema pretiosum]ATE56737.1 TIGR03085 family protein [Actinosynnema pretiosum]
MGLAQDERRLLAELFTEVGPDAPTLCDPWRTKDLAAHLVLRERRPDAAAGLFVKPLGDHTQKVQDDYAAKPWAELVDLVRVGPPKWSPLALLDEKVNGMEYFVHHEDVRRALDGWEPRPADVVRDADLWRALPPIAKLNHRKSPVGVVLRRTSGETITAKAGPTPVTITGEPAELALLCFGRDAVRVSYEGDPSAVEAVRSLNRST